VEASAGLTGKSVSDFGCDRGLGTGVGSWNCSRLLSVCSSGPEELEAPGDPGSGFALGRLIMGVGEDEGVPSVGVFRVALFSGAEVVMGVAVGCAAVGCAAVG
jgi:hypothetical protein